MLFLEAKACRRQFDAGLWRDPVAGAGGCVSAGALCGDLLRGAMVRENSERAAMRKVVVDLDELRKELCGNSAHVRCPGRILKRLDECIAHYEALKAITRNRRAAL
jgi:hypothetical protein